MTDLLRYLPEGSRFNANLFKPAFGQGGLVSRSFVLACDHVVSGTACGRYRHSHASLSYRVEVPKAWKEMFQLETVEDFPIGEQPLSVLRESYQRVRPSMRFDLAENSMGLFDFRAYCYTLGFVAMRAGFDFDTRGQGLCAASTVPRTLFCPDDTSCIISPMLYRNSDEFVTILSWLRLSGVETVTVMNDSFPWGGRQCPVRVAGCLALRQFACVMHAANQSGCGNHHYLAFYRGLVAASRLSAHSDEGGWWRRCLRSAGYPRPCGVLAPVATTVMGVNTFSGLPRTECVRFCVAHLLSGSGKWALCDRTVAENGKPTLLERTGGMKRPGDVIGLMNFTHDAVERWLSMVDDREVVHSNVLDQTSFLPYFSKNSEDCHFSGRFIAPAMFVEPTGTCTASAPGLPGHHGGRTTLRIFPDSVAALPPHYEEAEGRVFSGSSYLIISDGFNPRMNAAMYLLSEKYSPKNGLHRISQVVMSDFGAHRVSSAFYDPTARSLADSQWRQPDCPVPHPVEGITPDRQAFLVSCDTAGRTLLASELGGECSSRVGPFRLVDHSSEEHTSFYGHISPTTKAWLLDANAYSETQLEFRAVKYTLQAQLPSDARAAAVPPHTVSMADVAPGPEDHDLTHLDPPPTTEEAPVLESEEVAAPDFGVEPVQEESRQVVPHPQIPAAAPRIDLAGEGAQPKDLGPAEDDDALVGRPFTPPATTPVIYDDESVGGDALEGRPPTPPR